MMVAANDEQPCIRPREETYKDMLGPGHRGIEGGREEGKKSRDLVLKCSKTVEMPHKAFSFCCIDLKTLKKFVQFKTAINQMQSMLNALKQLGLIHQLFGRS